MASTHTHEIEKLYYQYAYGIDGGDFESVAQLLKDASIHGVEDKVIAQGAEQIKSFYDQIIKIHPDTGTPKTQHLVSNILVQSENEDTLKVIANYSVFQKLDSGKIETIICGQYHSLFKHSQQGWVFHQHKTIPLMVGDMTNHLNVSIKDIADRSKK